jgi:hypothetical protein
MRFVYQSRGVQRLAGLFLCQLLRRQLSQLIVDQRQELLGRVRVALLDRGKDAGHIAHDAGSTSRRTASQAVGHG